MSDLSNCDFFVQQMGQMPISLLRGFCYSSLSKFFTTYDSWNKDDLKPTERILLINFYFMLDAVEDESLL